MSQALPTLGRRGYTQQYTREWEPSSSCSNYLPLILPLEGPEGGHHFATLVNPEIKGNYSLVSP